MFKKKFIVIDSLIVFVILSLFLLIMANLDYIPARIVGDFSEQHIRFIDLLRNSYNITNDLASQFFMNVGGGQNGGSLIYYGHLNPYIIILQLFPNISTKLFIELLIILTIVLSFLSFYIILYKRNFSRVNCIVGSLLVAFVPSLLFHLTAHIMFIYYFPYFIISLLMIERIIANKSTIPFIILVGLVFYFNFFFIIIIGVIQVIYFFLVSYYEKKIKIRDTLKNFFSRLIPAYFISLLLGALPLLPQLSIIFEGGRGSKANFVSLFYKNGVGSVIYDSYNLGIGLIGIFILIAGILLYKNKKIFYLSSCLLILMFFGPIIYLLNGFLYMDPKIYIYIAPLMILNFMFILQDISLKKIIIAISSSVIIVLLMHGKIRNYMNNSSVKVDGLFFTNGTKLFYVICLLSIILIVALKFERRHKLIGLFVTVTAIVISFLNVNNNIQFIKNQDYNNKVSLSSKYSKDYFINNSNNLLKYKQPINIYGAINKPNNYIYLSLPGNYFVNFYNGFLASERNYRSERILNYKIFDNTLINKFTSIISNNDLNDTKSVRPLIYGVENDKAYGVNQIKQLSRLERIFALNQGIYVDEKKEESKNIQKFNLINKVNINDMVGNQEKAYNIDIPQKFRKKGVIILEGIIDGNTTYSTNFYVGDNKTYINGVDHYGGKAKDYFYLFNDINENTKSLKLKVISSANVNKYKDINVYYVDYKKYDSESLKYKNIENLKVDFNKSYKFDINMHNDGYLSTNIFYDKGFRIKINGKTVENKLINLHYIGTNIKKGKNSVEITYEMPGFDLGKNLTFIAIVIIFIIGVRHYFYKKKHYSKHV